MKKFKLSSLWLVPTLALLTVLSACGGGGGDDAAATPTTPATVTLRSIAVTVPNATIPIGTNQTLVATGTYSDGSTKPLTAATGVTWAAKSASTAVLQVFTTGIVTAKAVGTETVTATQDNITGSINLTVTSPWTMVAAGGKQTIARKADGNLYSWGSNLRGQLGDNTTIDRATPVQVTNPAGTGVWKQIVVGDQFAVGIRVANATATSGTLWAWGFNQNGRLGLGTTVVTDKSVPTQIGTATNWVSVAAGNSHALALNVTGQLYAWGRNFNGQLGDTLTTADSSVPKLVGGTPTTGTGTTAVTWIAMAAGDSHSLGIQRDGSLWAWGNSTFGQVGNASTTTIINTPTKIGTSTWTGVTAGAFHSVAIRADGTLWAWGQNTFGQLGNNGSTQVATPVQIGSETWSMVSGGLTHTMGVRTDGTLWGWGNNDEGQLGDGGISTAQPVQVGNKSTWSTVSAAAYHSFGLQTDNTLWGWGRNLEGQLGNGTRVQSSVPVNVPN